MKKFVTVILLSILLITTVSAKENNLNTFIFSIVFNIGSFSAGENDGGSVFLGSSLSVDWIPNNTKGLLIGLETGLLSGKKQDSNNSILGIPLILRFGWQPDFLSFEKVKLFIVGKAGWGFGIWGSELENGSRLSVCAEIGYNYYGLARNVNFPEYPLGYGSGKVYSSIGLSFN